MQAYSVRTYNYTYSTRQSDLRIHPSICTPSAQAADACSTLLRFARSIRTGRHTISKYIVPKNADAVLRRVNHGLQLLVDASGRMNRSSAPLFLQLAEHFKALRARCEQCLPSR